MVDEALDPEELASASALAPLVRERAPFETVRSRLRLAKQALRHRAVEQRDCFELWSVSASAALTFRTELSSGILAEAFAGPGLELVRFEPRSAATADAVPTRGLRLGFHSVPRVLLVSELQVALHRAHDEVRRGELTEVVADAPCFVPALGLGLEL